MAWRFRKTFCPLPGVRLTLSPRGISTSVGVGPLRINNGSRGSALMVSVPGTRLSYRRSLASGRGSSSARRARSPDTLAENAPVTPEVTPFAFSPAPTNEPGFQDIQSAGSGALTTAGLSDVKRLLLQSHKELGEIRNELVHWRDQEESAVTKYKSWANGWLLHRLLKKKFEQLRLVAEDAVAHSAELEEQERLAKLQMQLDLPPGVQQTFHRLSDEFSVMATSRKIWDTVGERATT